MDRPLVVTDPSEQAPELIREAGELAEAVDRPLYVLTVISQEEFDNDAEVMETISNIEQASYKQQPAEYAENVAESAVKDLLLEYDIETEAIGRTVAKSRKRSDTIIETAQEYGCDYIFLSGRQRSPTGKVIFGDTAQDVILNFDGYVVTRTH